MILISCINIVYQSIRISGVSAARLREFNCILLKLVTISLSTLLVSASCYKNWNLACLIPWWWCVLNADSYILCNT